MQMDILKKKNGNEYLIFDSVDENKKLLKKYNDVWNGIKNKIIEVSDSECDYEKDYMKIKFNSDDNLPLSKPLKFRLMTIIIRSPFEEEGKLYPQLFLHDNLSELDIKFCFFINFLVYIKMSENTEEDLILN